MTKPHQCPQCDSTSSGVDRRLFLQAAGASAMGVSLGGLGAWYNPVCAEELKKQHKHVLLIWLAGGSSQFETWDPKPGRPTGGPFKAIPTVAPGVHICELLADCPRLTDVRVSLPSMCSALFANERVRWRGDCQMRALGLCGVDDRRSNEAHSTLKGVLKQARRLITARARGHLPAELTLELFYANMIFDPHAHVVHGDFDEGEVFSQGGWPARKEISRKGPYGSTGLYGKMEEEVLYSIIEEDDLFAGLARNLVRL